mmetsp:Transcript_6308/g.14879  ORF Transcript_6308/g.14879 Transcript_6308/m.14879 type:complete len:206 (-) Transcript_6308:365-982(-)
MMFRLLCLGLLAAPALTFTSSRSMPTTTRRVARQATLTMRKGRPTTKLSKASSGKKPAAGPNSMGKAGDWALLNGGAKEEEFLPMEDGGIKSVDVRGKTGTYMAVRRGETLIGTDISCTKCKYPLLSAEVRDCADGDGGELKCALCGAVYSLETGALTGTEAKGGIAGMFGNMMAKNDGSDLEIFEIKKDAKGKVYMDMKIDYSS